jgi:PKD repeat protein
MKNYKSLITSSLIAAIIIASPIATFAEGNGKDKKDNENKKVKVEQVKKEKEDKKERGNSFNNGFTNWFNKRINATATVNANLAPSIEGITAPTVLKVGEVGTWIVKASDPKNGVLRYAVDWGDKNIVSKSLSLLSTQVFVQTGTFTHTYANKGEYRVMFTVENEAGLKTVSSVTVHVREAQNITAPVISNINVTNVKNHKATLTWITDKKSNTMIWISKTSPVDTTLSRYNSRKALVLKHKMEVNKLEANTKYYVVVGSRNAGGTTKSSEISFTTLPKIEDNKPVITSLSGPTTIKTGETATVIVNAYNPKNENLSYSANWGDASIINQNALETTQPIFVQTATFSHVYSTVGTYTATFTVENSKGEKTSSSMKIEVTPVVLDTTAPVISGTTTTVSGSNATIAWTTNEPATSNVFYSTGTPVDTTVTTTPRITDGALVTSHSLSIPSLTSSTLYHFIIKSADSSNNVVLSSESTFTTN